MLINAIPILVTLATAKSGKSVTIPNNIPISIFFVITLPHFLNAKSLILFYPILRDCLIFDLSCVPNRLL
ncbi:hypothetical protein A35_0062 (plasmid) [Coxiella burnetii 'MSU Goat Q177']|nr:hypothetical protein A35_0062 [Coxiella burnetii 'MSU Goat Q177']